MAANVFHASNQLSRSETTICPCQSATIDRLGEGGVYIKGKVFTFAYSPHATFLGGALMKVREPPVGCDPDDASIFE